jgi:hypothetical protein
MEVGVRMEWLVSTTQIVLAVSIKQIVLAVSIKQFHKRITYYSASVLGPWFVG